MRRSLTALLVAGLLAVFNACINSNNVTTSGTSFMWVATQGDQKVTAFNINLSNGAASQVGAAASTGVQPVAMILAPDGKTLFIANSGDNTITAYGINSDGSVTAQGSAVPAGQLPVALAADPSGKFLFVANQGTFGNNTSGTVSVFSIQGTSLTPVAGSPFPTELPSDVTGTGPAAVVASPTGNFLYVANQFTNTVSIFSYDMNGFLTQSGASPVPAGANPSALAFSRCAGVTSATANCTTADGNNLFVADSGSNEITVFAACIQTSGTCGAADGTLHSVAGSPFAAGTAPVALMVHPTLNFVYAVDSKSNQISQYKYSPATGALTALSPAASTGIAPFSAGITSAGNWAYATNNGGSNLSAFSVGTGGKLGPAATSSIALSGQPSAIVVE